MEKLYSYFLVKFEALHKNLKKKIKHLQWPACVQSQLRARTTDSTPPIRPRPETSVASVRAIQVISAPFVVRCC